MSRRSIASILVVLAASAACSRQRANGPAGQGDAEGAQPPAAANTTSPSTSAGTFSDVEAAAVLAVDSAFAAAVRAGDAAAIANSYAQDAVLMPEGHAPIQGRAAIEQFFSGMLKGYTVDAELGMDELDGRGDLAYARGHYQMNLTPKAAGAPRPPAMRGKYLEILRRQSDGTWLYTVDMFSSNAPPAARR